MKNYLTQIRLLGEASSKIQDAINESQNLQTHGMLYAAQDILTSQTKTLLALESEQCSKLTN